MIAPTLTVRLSEWQRWPRWKRGLLSRWLELKLHGDIGGPTEPVVSVAREDWEAFPWLKRRVIRWLVPLVMGY